jgi:spore coat protein YutH
MKAFLFDKYGYYPASIEEDSSFIYKGWKFKLEQVDNYQEKDLTELANYAISLSAKFNYRGGQLVKNRNGNYKTDAIDQSVCLVSVPIAKVTFDDLLMMHNDFKNKMNQTFFISSLLKLWEARFDFIEKTCISSIRIDDDSYKDVIVSTNLAFGMAENSLQYLADAKLDYGDNIENLTLVHKRLSKLESWYFFNPFNLVCDNAIRDLAELFKADAITTEELINLIGKYNFSKKEISIFMARLLFPTNFFDLLENHYAKKIDIRKDSLIYHKSMERLLSKLRNMHIILVRTYQIRPLDWLINQK